MIKIPAGEFLMGRKQEKGRKDENPKKIFLDTYEIDAMKLAMNVILISLKTHVKNPPKPLFKRFIFPRKGEMENLPLLK
ncbi:MAG: hypothetical protein CM1200mP16_06110 [Nitrospina sp.]|nr:MAG: hypothetical protein CM1200mP16_06110 [Nitrospina sp.]